MTARQPPRIGILSEDVDSAGLAEFRIIDPPRIRRTGCSNRVMLIPLVMLARARRRFGSKFRDGPHVPHVPRSVGVASVDTTTRARKRIDARVPASDLVQETRQHRVCRRICSTNTDLRHLAYVGIGEHTGLRLEHDRTSRSPSGALRSSGVESSESGIESEFQRSRPSRSRSIRTAVEPRNLQTRNRK